jgi:hypothetical protein
VKTRAATFCVTVCRKADVPERASRAFVAKADRIRDIAEASKGGATAEGLLGGVSLNREEGE